MKIWITLLIFFSQIAHATDSNFADAKISPISFNTKNPVSPLSTSNSKERNLRFDFQYINVAQVLQLIYSEALHSAYVLDPDVLSDTRLVSFRYEEKNGDLKYIFATGHNLRIFNSSKEFVDQLEKDKIEKKKAIENLYAHLNRPDKSFKTLKYLLCNKF